MAGVIAASRCAEAGLSVVLLEAGETAGGNGNARISTGVSHLGWLPLDAEPDEIVQRIDEMTDGQADRRLVEVVALSAAPVGRWLRAAGVTFAGSKNDWSHRFHATPHGVNDRDCHDPERGPDQMMRTFDRRAAAAGVVIELGTRVVDLERTGKQWTVTAEGPAGGSSWTSRAVCLSDGGFQASSALVERHVGPGASECLLRAAPTGRGDALTMAVGAGAGVTDLERFYGHLVSRTTLEGGPWPYPTLHDLAMAGVLLHESGQIMPRSPTVETPARQIVVDHAVLVDVRIGDRVGSVRRPTLLGAVIAKAAADTTVSSSSAAASRHLEDFVAMSAMLRVSDLAEANSTKSQRRYVSRALGRASSRRTYRRSTQTRASDLLGSRGGLG